VCSKGREAGNGTGRKCKLATWRKDKTPANKKGKGKMPPQVDIKKESICFFY